MALTEKEARATASELQHRETERRGRVALIWAAIAQAEVALKACIDSLEYVNDSHPEATGWGVRAERIQEATSALRALRALKVEATPWP